MVLNYGLLIHGNTTRQEKTSCPTEMSDVTITARISIYGDLLPHCKHGIRRGHGSYWQDGNGMMRF